MLRLCTQDQEHSKYSSHTEKTVLPILWVRGHCMNVNSGKAINLGVNIYELCSVKHVLVQSSVARYVHFKIN